MVVCKFFQQGNCRYGQNCRFEHVYGSKYTYHSSAPTPAQAAPAAPAVTDEQLINQVHSDVHASLRGGQWILSSYAPFKEKPTFPGIIDLSPEEARLFIYEAKANNNLEQAIAYMNNLFKEARTKYEQLLLKNTNITRVFRSLYKGENVTSPFEHMSLGFTSLGNNNPASSVFRSAVQTTGFGPSNPTPSIFSQNNNTPSVFAQNASPSIFSQNTTSSNDPAKSIFNQNTALPNDPAKSIFSQNTVSTNDPAKSIFAQASQSIFDTQQNPNIFANNTSNMTQANIFGPQPDTSAKSIFAQATQNAFAQPPAQSNPASIFATANQSIFSQNQQSSPFSQNQNVFQKEANQHGFGVNQNVFQQVNPVDMSFYSKMEDLRPEDLEAFKNDDFKIGFVPEVPPPHSLCF